MPSQPKVSGLFCTVTLIGLLVISATGSAWAQSSPRSPIAPPPSPPPANNKDDHDNDVDFGSRETDTRTRLILKAEKKAYEEHVARAKEASDLAGELKTSYAAANTFTTADQKKLERLEKLTKRIRNDVGGSEMDADPKDIPNSLSDAVNVLADMARELYDEVEKTPRHVVSAPLIEQANKMLTVIQFVRGPHH
ncbi:MAG TPA: hypothetical protein VFD75_19980 [Pyrinomonadaceae bacterium]|jgi:hypothetical protein|nr:hypothetical protein [Pyrinomonadaceae bacterium]